MSYVETKDLRLIYFDDSTTSCRTRSRTFTNSLAWQRRTFGWVPSESTTILLKDFADYGSGAAVVAPRNRLFADIAPISHAFETYPASERMYSLMNHELVHVATGDIAVRGRTALAAYLPGQGRIRRPRTPNRCCTAI